MTTATNDYEATRAKHMKAFDLVCDKADWKAPIDAKVDLYDATIAVGSPLTADVRAAVREAVIFFTATVPTITTSGRTLYVKADGYRAGPAGDH